MPDRPVPDRAGRNLGNAHRAGAADRPETLHRVAGRAPGDQPQDPVLELQRFVRAGLVTRTSYPKIPPHVEYRLTPAGERLRVVLDTMATWAEQDLPRQTIPNP
jgi:hypothetical protein